MKLPNQVKPIIRELNSVSYSTKSLGISASQCACAGNPDNLHVIANNCPGRYPPICGWNGAINAPTCNCGRP